jgi:hypothetical protein
MSGTPGTVSFNSACDRLLSIPKRAIRRWNGRKSATNALSLRASKARTNSVSAASYSALTFTQLVCTLASRTALSM